MKRLPLNALPTGSREQYVSTRHHITYLLWRSHRLAAGCGPWRFWRRIAQHAVLGGGIGPKAAIGHICIHVLLRHLVQRMLRTGGSAGAEADAIVLQRAGSAPGVLQAHGLGRVGSMRVPERAIAVRERPARAACHMLVAPWLGALLLSLLLQRSAMSALGRAPCTGQESLIGWLQMTCHANNNHRSA